jgi:hypothetical protein
MAYSPGYRLNTPLVALQEIEGEAILINFDTGCYFSANRPGAALFELARSGASTAALIRGLANRRGVSEAEVETAVRAFLAAAQAEGLLVPFEANGDHAPHANGTGPLAAEAPRFEKFDDLQDLLMLDPIHDVDQVGWPMQALPSDAPPDYPAG